MPDWTYHPLFKPLLFQLPAETARRAVMGALALQGATAAGRALFRWFSPPPPAPDDGVSLFGLRFPARAGLGPHIDIDATAIGVLPALGLGFVVAGPAARDAKPRSAATRPRRLTAERAIVSSPHAAAPAARAIAERLAVRPDRSCPAGLELAGDDLAGALADAAPHVDFLVLPARAASELEPLRAATDKPLLVRVLADVGDDALDALVDAALAARINGVVVGPGTSCPLLPDGVLEGPFSLAICVRAVERIAKRAGARLPIVAGGCFAPDDARALRDAGASLVELGAGFVYAGPGLAARITDALRTPHVDAGDRAELAGACAPHVARSANASRLGPLLVAATGAVLIAAGLFALILAATVRLLPYDIAYLGVSMDELCARGACSVVHFMAHDRVSFGGSIISIGILYVWLGLSPLRRGEPWALWAAVVSGAIGFGSFLTYLGYGYLDVWHGLATLALLPVFVGGLALAWRGLSAPRGPSALLDLGARAWRWSPGGLGRALVSFSAFGIISGGALIMGVGMTRVFVPQDLEYMQTTVEGLRALSPRLVPLIAHDRAGFGGGLCSTGLMVAFCLVCGLKPGERGLWWALLSSGVIGFGCAIGVHPIVGYTSFVHLAPAYAGALTFLAGVALLHRPMCREPAGRRFADV